MQYKNENERRKMQNKAGKMKIKETYQTFSEDREKPKSFRWITPGSAGTPGQLGGRALDFLSLSDTQQLIGIRPFLFQVSC